MDNSIKRVMLLQPNYAIFGKRTWEIAPYNLGLLNACLKPQYDAWIFDPNYSRLNEKEMRSELRTQCPDAVGITSFSTEYIKETLWYCALVKEELPDALVILGGIIPTVVIEQVVHDSHVDYFVIGEGEYRFPDLLDALNNGKDVSLLDGIAFSDGSKTTINDARCFIDNLDAIPLPDYAPLDLRTYGNRVHKYSAQLIARNYPAACTITTRGCPFNCIFCAAHTVSGKKVRMRSAKNVLREIDVLYNEHGIREIIFLDDHFLASKDRAIAIMDGIIERRYRLTWKCGNVAAWALNESILQKMKESGSYQMTISPESGNQEVVKTIIKKPLNLTKMKEMLVKAKQLEFELIANFIIGFPGETWEQIRDTVRYAEEIDVDMVNFHIATPLPKTELMAMCIEEGFVKSDDTMSGYTIGVIETEEFSAFELQAIRAFEWDRINFRTPEKTKRIAQMEGLTLEEVEQWRRKTRRGLGMTTEWNSKEE